MRGYGSVAGEGRVVDVVSFLGYKCTIPLTTRKMLNHPGASLSE